MRFFGVILVSIFISGQRMPKKPLWNFWHFLVPDTFHSSWDGPKWFSKGLFLILYPLLVRRGQKNDFEIFWMKQQNLFWPLYGVKGGPKCVLSWLFSLLHSFLARKCPKTHFEIFEIFGSWTPAPHPLTHLRSSKMIFKGVIFHPATIPGENRPKKLIFKFLGKRVEVVWGTLLHILGSKMRFSGV